MKILWHSTAPWSPSSYSVLTARAVPNIVKAGHKVAIGTWYGLQGQPLPWSIQDKRSGETVARLDVFPAGDGNGFSQDILVQLYKYIKAQVAIVCSDVWPFKKEVTKDIVFCPWLPIDHNPAPAPVLEALQTAVYPMVYSRWGQRVLADAGVKAAHVPCSAPGDVFKPGDKKKAREALGIIDKAKFIVGVVAANKDPQDRKGFSEAIQAFAKFAEAHEGAYMYLHTDVDGPINALAIAESLGVRKRIIQCDPMGYKLGMLDTGYMVNAYNACDVLLNLAKSEGFGLPIVEAQMCGVPVVATDFSTTNELIGGYGWRVPGQPHWSPGQDSWRMIVDIDAATQALGYAYRKRNNKTLKAEVRKFALAFDTDRVFNEYWLPALAEIERIVEGGQKACDFAKSFDAVPSQRFGAISDRLVSEDNVPEPEHFHEWAKIGINQNGYMCIPCLDRDCESELRIDRSGQHSINEGAFSPMVDGYHLKIEDSPTGAVAKIVIRELTEAYHLDKMDFSDGDVIIDIGAHVGIVSIFLGLKHPDITIYAFEPDPENYIRLCRNLKSNGVTNVTAINSAVTGIRSGETRLFVNQSVNSGGSTIYGNESSRSEGVLVQTVTLAEIFDQYGISECALLKVDCEGAEYEIFDKVQPSLLRRIKEIVGEFHTGTGLAKSPQALLDELSEFTSVKIGGISAIS